MKRKILITSVLVPLEANESTTIDMPNSDEFENPVIAVTRYNQGQIEILLVEEFAIIHVEDAMRFAQANNLTDVPPEVTYDVTSAAGDIGVVCFVGMISLDGVNRPVCGDDCIAGEACCPFMDADLSQPQCAACPAADCAAMPGSCADGRISLAELIGYACAWMTGCNDDLSGMTRAAFVWRNGECYCWDDADLNWHPTTCPAADSGCCTPSGRGSDSTVGSATAVVAWDSLRKSVRSSSDGGFNGTRELQITITVEPPPGTSATAVAMRIPRGWTVVTMSDSGQWDEVHRKVKWGPTFGGLAQSMTLRVRWLPGDAAPVSRRSARGGLAGGFEGVVSFDGMNQPISMP